MDDTECLICLEEFDTASVAILSCKHKYHYNCLTDWMKKSNKTYNICSLCNRDVEIVNIIDKDDGNINSNYQENNNQNIKSKKQKKTKEYNCCVIL